MREIKLMNYTKWMTEFVCAIGLVSMVLCVTDGLGITHLGIRSLWGV